jgi:tetratricopeptide (TPR) repeat protein
MNQQPPNHPEPGSIYAPRWRLPVICAGLALVVFIVFGQTLGHGFVNYDDNDYVYDNPMVSGGLSAKSVVWAFTTKHANNWHPVTWISHMIDCQLYGLRAGGHHFTNVLLHAGAVIMFFLLLARATGAVWRSAFVAVVFAIHPLRAESVAWIAERKDVLSGLFFVLTLRAYFSYASRPKSMARYALVGVLMAMGLMAKPMLVTTPLILLLLDYWPLKRTESLRKLIAEKVPFLILSAASCVATVIAQQSGIQSSSAVPFSLRIGNAFLSIGVYLRQTFIPVGLAAFYPLPLHSLPLLEVVLSASLVVGISALAWWQRRARPWFFVGWSWFVVMLIPALGILQVGDQAHADRYTYLPQIGLCIAVTWLAAECLAAWRLGAVFTGGLVCVIVAALTAAATKQTAYWKSDEALWNHALQCTTGNYVAHFNLGNAFREQGRMNDALAEFQSAVSIRADYPQAQNNLGKLLLMGGDVAGAVEHLTAALQLNPRYAQAHANLGNALMRMGNFSDAEAHFQAADELDPTDPWTKNNLAWILATGPLASLRDGARAIDLSQQAGKLVGEENPIILRTLAAAEAEAGRFAEATETAQRALQLAEAQNRTELARNLQIQLGFYSAGQPFRVGTRPLPGR